MNRPRQPSKDAVAYREITNLLFQGRLPPGQKIIYRDLEETLGMSKTPIITALTRLEQEGLVVSHQNRGFSVRMLSARQVKQMYDLRVRLEEIAIDYACAADSPRDVSKLEAALEAYLAYKPAVYDARMFKLDSAFHTAIAALGGNDFLARILEQYYLTGWVSVNVMVFTPSIDRFRSDHRDLVRAIKKGDRKSAKAIMRRHLQGAREAIAATSPDHVETDS
jgi:DNA-binding GntR family transcriptional regulator